jgi:hypothetical protein
VKHHLKGGYHERQAAAAVAASEDGNASAVHLPQHHNKHSAGVHGHHHTDAAEHTSRGRQQYSFDDADSDEEGPAAGKLQGCASTAAPSIAGPGSVADSASVFDAGSVMDGASEAPSSMSSAAGAGGRDEDLSVDTRYKACL